MWCPPQSSWNGIQSNRLHRKSSATTAAWVTRPLIVIWKRFRIIVKSFSFSSYNRTRATSWIQYLFCSIDMWLRMLEAGQLIYFKWNGCTKYFNILWESQIKHLKPLKAYVIYCMEVKETGNSINRGIKNTNVSYSKRFLSSFLPLRFLLIMSIKR